MADEQQPKSPENALHEVAKSIGSSLGTAANRASEMFRDVIPAALSEKLGVGGAQSKKSATSGAGSKPKKAGGAKKAGSASRARSASKKGATQSSAARKKSASAKSAAKKKSSTKAKKKAARRSR